MGASAACRIACCNTKWGNIRRSQLHKQEVLNLNGNATSLLLCHAVSKKTLDRIHDSDSFVSLQRQLLSKSRSRSEQFWSAIFQRTLELRSKPGSGAGTGLFLEAVGKTLSNGASLPPRAAVDLLCLYAQCDKVPPPILLRRLLDVVCVMLRTLPNSSISFSQCACLSRALPQLKRYSPELFHQLCEVATRKLSDVESDVSVEDVSILVTALAQCRHYCSPLMEGAKQVLEGELSSLKANHVVNALWSYAVLGHEAPHLCDTVTLHVSANISSFSTRQLAQIAWSLCVMDCGPDNVIECLKVLVTRPVAAFFPESLAQLVQIIACLAYSLQPSQHEQPLMDLCGELSPGKTRSLQRVDSTKWTTRHINSGSQLSGIRQVDSGSQVSDIRHINGGSQASGIRDVNSGVLVQLECWLDEQARIVGVDVSRDLIQACCAVWSRHLTGAKASRTQEQVAEVLMSLGWPLMCEAVVHPGVAPVDIILLAENKIAAMIEVDGPSHFSANQPFHPLGLTAFRARCLQNGAGSISVVVVPFYEWDSLVPAQRPAYLASKLAEGLA